MQSFERKRRASDVICFWNYRVQNVGPLKYLKSPVSEHLRTVNMLKNTKDCLNLHGSIFFVFSDHSERKSAPKFCFRSLWNLETVCEHIDTRWNAMIPKIKKKKSLNFLLVFRNLRKLCNPLKKKDECQTLFVSQIIDCKKWGHLNTQKALC